jgi:CheY-like chemotaxis protein
MPYSTHALAGKVVLVAEDEYMLADAIEAAIRSAGGAVLGPFPTVVEALDNLARAERQPDAAALNISLLDGASYPVAAELQRRGVPFVFASASSIASIPASFARVPLVAKPYAAYQVVQALSSLLDLPESLHS